MWKRPDPTEANYFGRLGKCKQCQESIVWMKTFKGKNIAVDADSAEPEDEMYNKDVHHCHWEHCLPEGGTNA